MDRHESGQTFTNIDELVEHTLAKLGAEGIGNTPTDPPVAILIRTTGQYDKKNEAEMTSIIYVGATDAEIANDLNPVKEEAKVALKEQPKASAWR